MTFDLDENVHAHRDDGEGVQQLEHVEQPFLASGGAALGDALANRALAVAEAPPPTTPQALAEAYLRQVGPGAYGLDAAMLPGADFAGAPDALDGGGGEPAAGRLELAEEKELMGTTTVSYQQTYQGLPVWGAGVSVTILPEPMRVTASQSSVHHDLALANGDALDDSGGDALYGPDRITPGELASLLGVPGAAGELTINGTRALIYRYDPEQRFDPETRTAGSSRLEEAPPTLPLPPVPDSVAPGAHHVVTEALFTLPLEGFGPLHWRALVEVHTGAVLYLRAFVACATGMVFARDPRTAGAPAGVTPTAGAAALNTFRSSVTLQGLTIANPQPLAGQLVRVVDNALPTVAAPTRPNPPASFVYDAPAREFAAVNAYHHCDWFFRLMQGMGFNLSTYFDGTTFPVPVDACAFGDAVNARAPGNATGTGSGGFQFGLAGSPFPAVSIAADLRVVLHEFGHALLWDSVHSPNFGFAHSAGDSLAAILLDPESALRADPVLRFTTFPWVNIGRSHGREVSAGWGWGGANDVGGYSSEQILSTTLFRLYRSLGGDSADLGRRQLAARQAVYLIVRAIGSLASNPVTPTPTPAVFATALMNADIGTLNFEGYRGGAFHKVVRWAFEKQGLYQPAGAPRPVARPGAPPPVDVYIDDGRGGEYGYQAVHWDCRDVWNRLAPGAGGGGGVHQTPVVGQVNYAYVRVKNRGTVHAQNVVVRGYAANPGAGLSWPGDWRPMDTPSLAVAGGIAPGASVVVGPFRWRPRVAGHECMFMEVSCPGDRSNIDPATFFPCAAGPMPEWRLVPFDNNLAQRNVAPVPGSGGVRGLLAAFLRRLFTVRNPFEKQVRVEVRAELPALLAKRGWKVRLNGRDGAAVFALAPGAAQEVTVALHPGREFTAADVARERGAAVRVVVRADDTLIGGMTYELDPRMKEPPVEKRGEKPVRPNDPAVTEAIRDARLLDAEAAAAAPAAGGETGVDGADGADEGYAPDEAGDEPPPEEVDGAAGAAGQLLSHLGVDDGALGGVERVRVRKVVVEIEMDGDD